MSLRNHTHLKLIGAAGAAALAIGTVATPAVAATHDLTYTCGTPVGPTAVTFNPGKIPAKMVAGQTSKRAMTLVVHLDQTQTGLAQAVGDHVRGTGKASGKHNTLPFSIKFPNTAIPQTPGATMDINGTGKGTIRPLKAGTWTVKAGTMAATLIFSSGGTDTTTLPAKCTAPTDGTQTFGTIKVGKDKTKTAASASYSSKKHSVTGSAKVKSHFGLKPTGKVTFTLMRGTHKVATQKGKLNKKGVAKAAFKHVTKKGDYALVAKYAGNKNLKGSSSGQPFVV